MPCTNDIQVPHRIDSQFKILQNFQLPISQKMTSLLPFVHSQLVHQGAQMASGPSIFVTSSPTGKQAAH
jgi:hypothetical protein